MEEMDKKKAGLTNPQIAELIWNLNDEDFVEVFENIRKRNPKETEIIILPGCNHGNGMYKQTELYQNKIKQFLEKHL